MPSPKTWPKWDFEKGVMSSQLKSWSAFHDFVTQLLDLPHYIFRGQRRDDWLLESTITRDLKKRKHSKDPAETHLHNFRYAVRGRRGANPPRDVLDEQMWALGQHHGLSTPLLDWTASPYVALFFAFAKSDPSTDTPFRTIYGLNVKRATDINLDLADDPFADDPIEFFNPLSDENARLVSQAGSFTKLPYQQDLESWVKKNYSEAKHKNQILLAKVMIPTSDRVGCLKSMNRMNINYSTLFPDIEGASRHCNLQLEIENY